EYDRALRELERARLQLEAAGTTVSQAQRVYDLTELRYREGLATQLDVSDARLALQQARLNEVTAYHDYQLALASALRALADRPPSWSADRIVDLTTTTERHVTIDNSQSIRAAGVLALVFGIAACGGSDQQAQARVDDSEVVVLQPTDVATAQLESVAQSVV